MPAPESSAVFGIEAGDDAYISDFETKAQLSRFCGNSGCAGDVAMVVDAERQPCSHAVW